MNSSASNIALGIAGVIVGVFFFGLVTGILTTISTSILPAGIWLIVTPFVGTLLVGGGAAALLRKWSPTFARVFFITLVVIVGVAVVAMIGAQYIGR